MSTRQLFVRNAGEWGEFFVSEREPVVEDGRTRHSATWVCYSSFGVFGHHWYDMGHPFSEFVQGVGTDYLLSKIARQVFDDDKFAKWMRREIFTARASREVKSRAASAFRQIREDGGNGEAVSVLAYHDPDIGECDPEWSDADSRSYDPQAAAFVEKLWPKFVEAVAAPAGETGVGNANGGDR